MAKATEAFDDRLGDRAFLPKIAKGFRRLGHMMAFVPFMAQLGGASVAIGYMAEISDSLFHGKFMKGVKQLVMGAGDVFMTGFLGEYLSKFVGPTMDIPILSKIPILGGLFSGWGASGLIQWAKEPLSLIATGKSSGELTRTAIGTVLDAPAEMADSAKRNQYRKSMQQMPFAGGQPQTIGYAPAAVGWAPGMQQQMAVAAPQTQQDRYWFNMEAQRRGADPEQAYRNFRQGNVEHVAALEEARSQTPQEHQLA